MDWAPSSVLSRPNRLTIDEVNGRLLIADNRQWLIASRFF